MIRRHFTQLLSLIVFTCLASETIGDDSNYIDAERRAIDELRPLIAEYLVPDYMNTDVYHLRLLKASKFDVKNAVQMAKNNAKWRKTNNVDKILDQDLNKYFPDIPVKVEGVDKEGDPIIQFYYGKWQFRKYALSDDPELRIVPVRVFLYALETVEQRLYEIQKSGGQNISSAYAVSNLEDFSINQHICPRCLSLQAELFRTIMHYPSLCKKAVFINAPRIYARVHQLLNEIIPSDVTQVISVYSPNDDAWRNVVLKDVSAEQLPKDFGGTQENWFNKY